MPCTHNNEVKFVMKIGAASVHAGAGSDATSRAGWALAVRLSGKHGADFDRPFHADKAAEALLGKDLVAWTPPPMLTLEWDDRGVPPIGAEWWRRFIEALKKVEGRVVFYCIGGHGRTGTALAILAGLSGQTKGDVVKWVRKVYCEKAVETNAQLDYFEEVTGLKTKEAASDFVHTAASAGTPSFPASKGWKGGTYVGPGNAYAPQPGAAKKYSGESDIYVDDQGVVHSRLNDAQDWEGPHHRGGKE